MSKEFFLQPAEVKQQVNVTNWRDVGYLHTESVKEFWQVNKQNLRVFFETLRCVGAM